MAPRRIELRQPASTTSRRLFHLRVAPAVAATAVAWVGIPIAFSLWEPAGKVEPVGPAALALAVAGAALIASSFWRLTMALRETQRIHRSLVDATRASLPASPLPAFVIDSRFPIVALVGLFVSRLFVARTVVEACDAGELRAVVAHEQAHAGARDNLRRLLMAAAPDALAWLPVGAGMMREWGAMAELAADETAVSHFPDRLNLASALVKVARLATTPPAALPASTLYRGEPIAERVHRLLRGTGAAGVGARVALVTARGDRARDRHRPAVAAGGVCRDRRAAEDRALASPSLVYDGW